jgi:hypothetical protein
MSGIADDICWIVSCSSGEKPGHDANQTKPGLRADHVHGTGSLPGAQDGAPLGQQGKVSCNARTQSMRNVTTECKSLESFSKLICNYLEPTMVHIMTHMQVWV